MIDCSKCHGYCCRKAGLLDPNLNRGDGCCKYLNKDNKCDIYDHRPLICNTDRMYQLFFNNMSREEYDKLKNTRRKSDDFYNDDRQEDDGDLFGADL